MDNAGVRAEWNDILRDLDALNESTIAYHGKTFAVRSNVVGVAGKIAQCVGVRLMHDQLSNSNPSLPYRVGHP